MLALQRLLPKVSWDVDYSGHLHRFLLPGGSKLAKLAFREIYQRDPRDDVAGDMVLRDETPQQFQCPLDYSEHIHLHNLGSRKDGGRKQSEWPLIPR